MVFLIFFRNGNSDSEPWNQPGLWMIFFAWFSPAETWKAARYLQSARWNHTGTCLSTMIIDFLPDSEGLKNAAKTQGRGSPWKSIGSIIKLCIRIVKFPPDSEDPTRGLQKLGKVADTCGIPWAPLLNSVLWSTIFHQIAKTTRGGCQNWGSRTSVETYRLYDWDLYYDLQFSTRFRKPQERAGKTEGRGPMQIYGLHH